jgi:hypothetical protein
MILFERRDSPSCQMRVSLTRMSQFIVDTVVAMPVEVESDDRQLRWITIEQAAPCVSRPCATTPSIALRSLVILQTEARHLTVLYPSSEDPCRVPLWPARTGRVVLLSLLGLPGLVDVE